MTLSICKDEKFRDHTIQWGLGTPRRHLLYFALGILRIVSTIMPFDYGIIFISTTLADEPAAPAAGHEFD